MATASGGAETSTSDEGELARQKRALNRCQSLLVSKLPTLEVLDILVEDGLFDPDGMEYQEIIAIPLAEHRRRSQTFLMHLRRQGPNAFLHFVNALRDAKQDCGHLVNQLLDAYHGECSCDFQRSSKLLFQKKKLKKECCARTKSVST